MRVPEEKYDIERIREGDAEAFRRLMERYQDMVFTLCVRMLRSDEDAKEVTQDVFVKAYRSISQYRGQSKFSTWLYRIAYNRCVSELRRRTKIIDLLEDVEGEYEDVGVEDGFQQLGAEDRRRFIQEALESLGESDAVVMSLFYLEELSLEEICEVTGMQNSNVRIRLHRARKKMMTVLCSNLKSEIDSIL